MSSLPVEIAAKPPEKFVESMRTSPVDLVSGLLLSLVIMVGVPVFMMAVVFYMSLERAPDPIEIVLEEERVAGRGDHAAGFARDLEPPGSEEVEQLTEPSVEQSLQAVSESLSSISASLEAVESASDSASKGGGLGDSRPPGPEGEGDDIVPRFERWTLKFSAKDVKNYGLQLDFFGIELAAIGGGRTEVDYVKNLTSSLDKRTGPGEAEKRLYFITKGEGPLLKYERDYLAKAGIPAAGRVVLKIISKEIEDKMALAEQAFAIKQRGKQVPVKELAATIFEVQPGAKERYEFVVLEQRYRVVK